jgi:20S proteasome subunit alpha 7
MASSGSGYDLSASTFSPDGRIFQIEYAGKAVDNAPTVIGLKCSDGIVLGALKPLLHKMVVSDTASYKRIHHVDVHAGMASAGFLPDARQLVKRAMDEACDYEEQYGIKIQPSVLADRLGSYAHYFTLHGALRPFGAACVLAAYDYSQQKPMLYLIEPSGTAYSYVGVATGKGRQAAKTELEQLVKENDNLNCAAAVQHVAKILLLLFREQKEHEGKELALEMSWLKQTSGSGEWKHEGVPKETIRAAQEWAKEQLEQDEQEEDDEDMEEAS